MNGASPVTASFFVLLLALSGFDLQRFTRILVDCFYRGRSTMRFFKVRIVYPPIYTLLFYLPVLKQ